MSYDVCVIGAGAAGLTTAAFCAKLGVRVVLIERHKMGGECLNFGCVPSKALLAAAKAGYDFATAMQHVQKAIEAIAPNDSVERFTGLGVRVILGEAAFKDAHHVLVNGELIHARKFVIATGSRPFVPPLIEGYLTNETLFTLQEKPRHLAILGGGAMGVEMAQAFADLGVKVSLVEATRLLAHEDEEAVEYVRTALKAKAVMLYEGASLAAISDYSHLLVATGRRPNLEGLNLEAAGVVLQKGLRTAQAHIYIVGDVNGQSLSTPAAGAQGAAVAAHILFKKPLPKDTLMPRVIYTDPQIATIGQTQGAFVRADFTHNDRAICENNTTGFIKLYHEKGKLKGVTLVGANVGEQLSLYTLMLAKKMTLSDVARLTMPYPTRSEIGKAAASLYYQDLAKKPFIRALVAVLKRF
jgi:pyruvate/2-oxoglutarate dehydrogenase complex dihydrolipoamide dehydrogenase (E3) component